MMDKLKQIPVILVSLVILVILGYTVLQIAYNTHVQTNVGFGDLFWFMPEGTDPMLLLLILAFVILATIGLLGAGVIFQVFSWIAAFSLAFILLLYVFYEKPQEVVKEFRKSNQEAAIKSLTGNDQDNVANQPQKPRVKVVASGIITAKYEYPSREIVLSRGLNVFWTSTDTRQINAMGGQVTFDQSAGTYVTLIQTDFGWFPYDELSCREKLAGFRSIKWRSLVPGRSIDIHYRIYKGPPEGC